MQKGICKLSVIPMRRIPSDKSEMVSQLLYGESFTITDSIENFVLISHDFDAGEGWIDQKQFEQLEVAGNTATVMGDSRICNVPISTIVTADGNSLHLSFGSILQDTDTLQYPDESNNLLDPVDFRPNLRPDKAKIVLFAKLFNQVPYLWGGKSIFGIDSSGLVQLVYKVAGFQLPRNAAQQMEKGTIVNFIEQAEPADLAFFDNDEGQIVHVGILINPHQLIHASGKVRIDSIDHYGIFNHELHRYTHRLRLIKRI